MYRQISVKRLFREILIKALLVLVLVFDQKETAESRGEMTAEALAVALSVCSYFFRLQKALIRIECELHLGKKKLKYITGN